MSEKRAIICSGCRRLIDPKSTECPYCENKVNTPYFPVPPGGRLGDIGFTKAIIAVNLIFFVLSYLLQFYLSLSFATENWFGALSSPGSLVFNLMGWADIRLIDEGSYWSLITAVFLHGGVLHIFFNMMWVKDLGPQVERMFSPAGMFIIFILSGIGGNITAVYLPAIVSEFLFIPMTYQPVIGASGAVFGLMGAIMALGKKRGGVVGRQMTRRFGMWAAIIIGMGFMFPNISNSAHIGGLVSGYSVAWLILGREGSPGDGFYAKSALALAGVCLLSFFLMFMRLLDMVSNI